MDKFKKIFSLIIILTLIAVIFFQASQIEALNYRLYQSDKEIGILKQIDFQKYLDTKNSSSANIWNSYEEKYGYKPKVPFLYNNLFYNYWSSSNSTVWFYSIIGIIFLILFIIYVALLAIKLKKLETHIDK
jgi:uncharacterized integral membrane protein